MIPVSDELKQATIHEVMPKSLTLDFVSGDITEFNWYKEKPSRASVSLNQDSITLPAGGEIKLTSDIFNTSQVNSDYFDLAQYVEFNTGAYFDNTNNAVSGDVFSVRVSFRRSNGSYYIVDTPNYQVSHFVNNAPSDIREERIYTPPILMHHETRGDFTNYYEIWLRNTSSTTPLTLNPYGFMVYLPMMSLQEESDARPEYTTNYATPEVVDAEFRDAIPPITNNKIVSESFAFNESICSAETLKLGGCEAKQIDVDIFNAEANYTGAEVNFTLGISNVTEKYEWKEMIISEAKKSAKGNTIIRHIKAYDKIKNLEQNAYAWYTQYAWAMNVDWHFTSPTPYVFDFERAIFSTFYNLMNNFGVDKVCEHTEDILSIKSYYETENDITFNYKAVTQSSYGCVDFVCFEVTPSNDYQAYKARLSEFENVPADYVDYDSLYRGLTSACVCVEFETDGHELLYGGLYDLDEPFILPPNCASFKVHVPINFSNSNGQYGDRLAFQAELYGVNFTNYNPNDIVNANQALPYYTTQYPKPTTDNICKMSSSVTAREFARSLMEICGCFFRLGRDGKPEFVYAMEHGLYPSNTLFPADDLFPKKSSELTMPTSYYIKANYEEFRSSNFGGVQVVTQAQNNEGLAVKYEYWWDEDNDNAYIIDDNVFLCANELLEAAGTSFVNLLQNLEEPLDNLQYTPFTAETIGTPFLESGDRFTLLTKTDGFESFIFERTLKGIQVLKDYYEARGVAKTPRVKNFEWGNTNE